MLSFVALASSLIGLVGFGQRSLGERSETPLVPGELQPSTIASLEGLLGLACNHEPIASSMLSSGVAVHGAGLRSSEREPIANPGEDRKHTWVVKALQVKSELLMDESGAKKLQAAHAYPSGRPKMG